MGLLEKIKKAFGGSKKEEKIEAPTEEVTPEEPVTPPVTPPPTEEEKVGESEVSSEE